MPGMSMGFGFGFHRRSSDSTPPAHEQLLTEATAAGAEFFYNADADELWELRDDGSNQRYKSIADAMGNREDWAQATDSLQPEQITLSNGRRAMLARDTHKIVAQFAAAIPQPNTVLIVGRSVRLAAMVRSRWLDGDSITGGRQIIGIDTNGGEGYAMWAASFVTTDDPAPNVGWHSLQANNDGANSELFLDGISIATGDAGTNALGGIENPANATLYEDVEIALVIGFTGKKSNTDLSDLVSKINALYPIKPHTEEGTFTLTTIQATGTAANGPDGIDERDILGDGTPAVLAGREDGTVAWWEVTSPTAATEHTINGTPRGTKEEGGCWADVEGNGQYIVVTADQGADRVSAYKPDDRDDYRGTWGAAGVISTSTPNAQQIFPFDIDGDGQEELFVTYEGTDGTSGGVLMLDYDGAGDPTDAANYTEHEIIDHPGGWWLIVKADKAILSARDNLNSAPTTGVYIYAKPATPTDPWTLSETVEDAAGDWLQIAEGDFFGNGAADLAAVRNDTTGIVSLYDASNAWAKTELYTVDARHNVKVVPNKKKNGRDTILVNGDGLTSRWEWNGEYWFRASRFKTASLKIDDRVPFFTVGGELVAYLADSQNDVEYLWRVEV